VLVECPKCATLNAVLASEVAPPQR
jgi:hypothetical protein